MPELVVHHVRALSSTWYDIKYMRIYIQLNLFITFVPKKKRKRNYTVLITASMKIATHLNGYKQKLNLKKKTFFEHLEYWETKKKSIKSNFSLLLPSLSYIQ